MWHGTDVDVSVAHRAAGVPNHRTCVRPMDRAPRLKWCVASGTGDRGTLPQRPADAVDFLGCIRWAVTTSAIGTGSWAPQVADPGKQPALHTTPSLFQILGLSHAIHRERRNGFVHQEYHQQHNLHQSVTHTIITCQLTSYMIRPQVVYDVGWVTVGVLICRHGEPPSPLHPRAGK